MSNVIVEKLSSSLLVQLGYIIVNGRVLLDNPHIKYTFKDDNHQLSHIMMFIKSLQVLQAAAHIEADAKTNSAAKYKKTRFDFGSAEQW